MRCGGKERVHRVRAVNGGGARTEVSVRSFELTMDEPPQRHGTDSAQTPLETVVAALVGCKGATIHSVAQAMRFAYAGVRCPVANMLRAAQVDLAIDWRVRPAAEADAD